MPITKFVGLCKSISGNSMPYSTMIKFAGNSIKAIFNITQTFTLSKLCKTHKVEMIPTREVAYTEVFSVPVYALIKFIFRHHIHKLSKNCFSFIHGKDYYNPAINLKIQIVEKLYAYNNLNINKLNHCFETLTGQ